MVTFVKVYFIDGETDAGVDTRDAVDDGGGGFDSLRDEMLSELNQLKERMKIGRDET